MAGGEFFFTSNMMLVLIAILIIDREFHVWNAANNANNGAKNTLAFVHATL